MMDNAGDNDTLLEAITDIIPGINPNWSRLRCIGHIINLIVKALLFGKGVSKLQREIAGASDDEAFKIWNKKGPIGKAHNITTYIGRTDERKQALQACQDTIRAPDEKVYYLQLLKDGGVKWNAVYTMIKRGTIYFSLVYSILLTSYNF